MARKKHPAPTPAKGYSTLGIDDEDSPVFPDGEPAEFVPAEDVSSEYSFDDYYEEYAQGDDPDRYSVAERVLTVATTVLACLLLAGSTLFWLYFVSRLSICPISILNHRLYSTMLVCCTAVPLAYAVSEVMRRLPVTVEHWMVSLCVSGGISAVIMVLFNTFTLQNPFSWMETLTILCFAVSACALPAAVFTALRWVAGLFAAQLRRERSVPEEILLADAAVQSESRFN